MKNKKLILGVVALVLVVTLMAGIYLAAAPGTVAGRKTITVTVIHSDGTERVFTCDTWERKLGPVLVDEGIVSGQMGPYGLMMDCVDGETADWNVNQSYWALFIGDEYAVTGVDDTPIHDGDSFKLVYTIG